MPIHLGPAKFLIVEDNQFMRNILLHVLRTLGVGEIKEAENGCDAIELLEAWRPDIAIIDWEMGPMDGIALVKWIRSDKRSPNPFLPVIMLTAHSEIKRVTRARDAGVTEYVVKPVSAKVMWSRIRAVIENPRRFVKTRSYFGPDRRRQDVNTGHEDRRGRARKEEAIKAMMLTNAPMSQDAINAYFNPDTEGRDPPAVPEAKDVAS